MHLLRLVLSTRITIYVYIILYSVLRAWSVYKLCNSLFFDIEEDLVLTIFNEGIYLTIKSI